MFATFATFVLDTAILIALVLIFGRDRRPKALQVVLVSLGIAGAYCLCNLLPIWLLGHLIVVPLFIFSGIMLMLYGRLKLKPAAIASGLFFAFHVVLGAILGWFF
ncbi:MAG: hypothetical protein ABIK89_11775 [Planctomycetota bacterium]